MTTTTADWYLGFAARDAAGHSPTYERLARAVVGASDGLCLYPDRWRYAYRDTVVGDPGRPLLTCETTGAWAGAHRQSVELL